MPAGEYATFLTNHDQNRVMSTFNGNVEKAKVAASLLLASPGTPFLYYGEEIGMTGQKPDEDIRLPMQWSGEAASAGFTTGIPWRTPGANKTSMNVDSEDKASTSLLNHYRALIGLRNQHPALQTGIPNLLRASIPSIYAILRTEGSETILVLINLSGETLKDFSLGAIGTQLKNGTYQLETIFGSGTAQPLTINAGKLSSYQPLAGLPPYSTTIFILK